MNAEFDQKMQNVIKNTNRVASAISVVSWFVAVIFFIAAMVFGGISNDSPDKGYCLLGIVVCLVNGFLSILTGNYLCANLELKQAQLMQLGNITDLLQEIRDK
jgi:hypothetical protein